MPSLKQITDAIQGKAPLSAARSSQWPTVRKNYLKLKPSCAVCGGTKNLEVHHKQPFHLHPELELDMSNFITLCESEENGLNCHLAVGHLGNFKSLNPDVEADAAMWLNKLSNRQIPKVAEA